MIDGVPAGDAALDHGRALDATVEDDGEAALDVLAGDALEDLAALVGERERHVPAAERCPGPDRARPAASRTRSPVISARLFR